MSVPIQLGVADMAGVPPVSSLAAHGRRVHTHIRCILRKVVLRVVVLEAMESATCIHKEVADCGDLKAKLRCNGDLHFFGGPLGFLEDGL